MRPIKFRAWDTKHNKWAELDDAKMNPLTGKIMEDVDNSCGDPECCGGPHPYFVDQDQYQVTQFTGLHDKNGKEIFEGDIANITYVLLEPDGSLMTYTERGVMYWVESEARFSFDVKDSLFDEDMEDLKIEVLGNVYEHPELIKGV